MRHKREKRLHWTQRPENRQRVTAAADRATRARLGRPSGHTREASFDDFVHAVEALGQATGKNWKEATRMVLELVEITK